MKRQRTFIIRILTILSALAVGQIAVGQMPGLEDVTLAKISTIAKRAVRGRAADVQPGQPTCVFLDVESTETCPVQATVRSFEIQNVGESTMMLMNSSSQNAVLVEGRLEDAAANNQIDENQAMLVEQELNELAGASYQLPESRAELMAFLGFPDGAEISDQDWVEMLRVHAEMSLSVSAETSRFLLSQIGIGVPVAAQNNDGQPSSDPNMAAPTIAPLAPAPGTPVIDSQSITQ